MNSETIYNHHHIFPLLHHHHHQHISIVSLYHHISIVFTSPIVFLLEKLFEFDLSGLRLACVGLSGRKTMGGENTIEMWWWWSENNRNVVVVEGKQ